jgi:GTP-binding protein
MFIDELTITVRSGHGGRGCESYFRRADHKRLPNGGDGAGGGNVIIKTDPHLGSLLVLRSKHVFEAEPGGPGSGQNKYGRRGKDCIIKVPCGTTIYNKTENLLIRDLVHPDEEVLVLEGGRGGYGNHAGRPSTKGAPAKELELTISLKIKADIFLVGLPNSGKTALLRQITNAHVAETHYPFATTVPQLGTHETADFSNLRICELPSIYQASETGRGLGTHFLKHLERARLIFFILDDKTEFAQGLRDGYDILMKVVEDFNPELLLTPRFLVVNKSDMLKKKESLKKLLPKDEKVYFVSAKDGTGLSRLMNDAKRVLGALCSKR